MRVTCDWDSDKEEVFPLTETSDSEAEKETKTEPEEWHSTASLNGDSDVVAIESLDQSAMRAITDTKASKKKRETERGNRGHRKDNEYEKKKRRRRRRRKKKNEEEGEEEEEEERYSEAKKKKKKKKKKRGRKKKKKEGKVRRTVEVEVSPSELIMPRDPGPRSAALFFPRMERWLKNKTKESNESDGKSITATTMTTNTPDLERRLTNREKKNGKGERKVKASIPIKKGEEERTEKINTREAFPRYEMALVKWQGMGYSETTWERFSMPYYFTQTRS